MKTLFKSTLLIAAFTLALTSCKDKCKGVTCPTGYTCNEGTCEADGSQSTNIVKSGTISANEKWTDGNVYELAGKVVVDGGATLTIEPGVIIKGREGAGSLASALVVARGSKIMAEGTKAKPIIFTSILDNIKPGELAGTNLDETDNGKWGGLIILGNAKSSVKVGDAEGQIEGIPADEAYGKYGGTDDADNSGVIKYVSIRHGGALIGEGNEINGLTLGGVGSGTTIDYVEVLANLDDGIECFGGAVDIKHALVAYQGDDAFDVDQNYSGTFSNSAVVYNDNGDEFMEIDGPEGSTYTDGLFTIENCTFISKTSNGTVDLKSKAQGTIKDCKFDGLTKFKLSASWKDDCATVKTDAYDRYVTDLNLEVKNNNTNAPLTVYTKSENESVSPATVCPIPASYQPAVDAIFNAAGNGSSATGADMTVFNDWTWTSIKSKF